MDMKFNKSEHNKKGTSWHLVSQNCIKNYKYKQRLIEKEEDDHINWKNPKLYRNIIF